MLLFAVHCCLQSLSIVSDARKCRVHAAACYVGPSPNRRRPLQYSSFSPAVVLALLRLPFLRLPFLLLFLRLLLLLLLPSEFSSPVSSSALLLLRLPAATALAVAAAAANATAALRLLLRPLPAAAAATSPGAAAAPGSKRKLTNSFSPAWKPLFLALETLVLKP